MAETFTGIPFAADCASLRTRVAALEAENQRLREAIKGWKAQFHLRHSVGLTIAPISECELCKLTEAALAERGGERHGR